ncbi:MAG: GNAT family N-acetyltransferase [Ruminococcaceae bacterium]|nr:GNAT family N-acetyltransferase [Oscillospiraceae bacterium]
MSEEIKIVKADASHYDDVKRIMVQAWTPIRKSKHERIGEDIASFNAVGDWKENQFSTIKERIDAGCGYVALVDANVAGFVTYRDADSIGDMIQIGYNAVDTSYKGRGLGTKMYDLVLGEAKKNGYKYARVHTDLDDNHAPARRSYAKAGFDRGLEEIIYYMHLDKRPDVKVNEDVVMVPATEKHLDEILKITVAAWTPIYDLRKKLLGEQLHKRLFTGWEIPKCESVKKAVLANEVYAAMLNGKVVGFITVRISGPNGEMLTLCNNAVNPEYAGKGIGSAMYKFVLDKAQENGAKYASVHTGLDDAHAPARKAYERVGFDRNTSIGSVNYYQMF